MKAAELKPGDIVAYNDTDSDRIGTVLAIKKQDLTIKLKHSTVQITYISSETTLEELGMNLLMKHSQVLDCVKSADVLVREG